LRGSQDNPTQAEQLICNQQVIGSNPIAGSSVTLLKQTRYAETLTQISRGTFLSQDTFRTLSSAKLANNDAYGLLPCAAPIDKGRSDIPAGTFKIEPSFDLLRTL
jgi:hypothetical protein